MTTIETTDQTGLLANLPMYDWPETEPAMNRFWREISAQLRKNGLAPPEALDRTMPLQTLWRSGRMILGQTCGWPYVNGVEDHASLVGLLDYDLPDCKAGYYRSVFVVQKNSTLWDIESAGFSDPQFKIAINGDDSQSGYRVLVPYLYGQSPGTVPERFLISGAHRNSIKAVADGLADLAAIDAMAFRLAERHEPQAVSKVRVIGASRQVPGTPLITSNRYSDRVEDIRACVSDAIRALPTEDRKALSINSLVPVHREDYNVLRAA